MVLRYRFAYVVSTHEKFKPILAPRNLLPYLFKRQQCLTEKNQDFEIAFAPILIDIFISSITQQFISMKTYNKSETVPFPSKCKVNIAKVIYRNSR